MKKISLLLFIFLNTSIFGNDLIAAFSGSEGSKMYKSVRILLDEIEEITNLEIKLINMPMKRCIDALLKGDIDLEIARTIYAYKGFDEIVYCKEPFISVGMYVYTKSLNNEDITINNLKNSKLVYTLGNKVIENWIKVNNVTNFVEAKSIYNSFKLLALDRADYILGPISFQIYINENNEFSEIVKLDKKLFIAEQFIVLHKRNSHLVPEISEAIKILKSNGTIQEIITDMN